MFKKLKTFTHQDCGAVTVDWVVITAMVIGLALAVFLAVETSALNAVEATVLKMQ